MALSERLALIITGDASGAIREFQKVGTAAEKDLGKATNHIDKIGSRLQIGGAAAVGFAAVAGRALFSFAKDSEQAHLQQVKLDNTLKNAPQLANANRAAFLNLATAIQKKTVADDDAVVGAEAVLGQFGLTEQQILTLTPLVVDLSRKMGIDLDAAARAVGKTVGGNAGALARMGIKVDESKFKTDAFGATMTALSTKVGGFSEQEGKTFQGRLEILKNRLDEVKEGIGAGVIDAMSQAIGPVSDLSDKFAALPEPVQSTVGQLATFGTLGLGTAGTVAVLAGSVLKAKANFENFASTFPRLSGNLSNIGKTAGIAVTALLGFEALKTVKTALDGSGASFKHIDTEIERLGKSGVATGDVAKLFGDDMQDLGKIVKRVGDEGSWDKINDGVRRFDNAINVIPGKTKNQKFAETRSELDKLDKRLADMVADGNAEQAAAAFKTLSDEAANQGVSQEIVNRAFNDYQKAVEDADKATKGQKDSAQEAAGAQDALGDATGDTTDEIKAQAQAAEDANKNLEFWKDALFGLRDAERDVQGANLDLGEALDTYNEKQKAAADQSGKNVEANREYFRSANDVKAKIDQIALAAEEQYRKQLELTGGTYDAADAALVQRDALIKQRDTIAPGSPFRAYLDTLIADLDKAASQRYGTLTISSVIDSTTRTILNTLSGAQTSSVQFFLNAINGRAAGGPVAANRPYLVGEEGPELFVPNSAGRIVPNGRGGSSSFRGSNDVHIEVKIYNPSGNGDEIARQLVASLKNGTGRSELTRLLAS